MVGAGFIWSLLSVLLGITPGGRNLVKIDGQDLWCLEPLAPWAYEIPHWQRLPDDLDKLQLSLQPHLLHGVNGAWFTLHDPASGEPFFRADGGLVDEQAAKRFTKSLDNARGCYLPVLVSLFAADDRASLESPDAYRRAVEAVTKLVPKYYACVLVLGDLGKGASPAKDAPLREPALLQELAAILQKADKDCLVGVPASVFEKRRSDEWLYVAANGRTMQVMMKALAESAPVPPAVDGLAIVRSTHVLFYDGRSGDAEYAGAVEAFARQVERTRLAIPLAGTRDTARQPGSADDDGADTEGWIDLFDGKTLTGWTTLTGDPEGWKVVDGAIQCSGTWSPWLRCRLPVSDFALRFAFKINENCNSGVFLRAPLEGRSSRIGMEMQLFGRRSDSQTSTESTGAIYSVRPPTEDATNPPGQWNQAEITCAGPHITIRINGRTVQDWSMDEVPELQNRLRHGYIGLQDHGGPAWFRDIRIKPIIAGGRGE